jgi:ribosomal protein L11 methyltransferase
LSSQLPEEKFDIVLANINRNVILQYLPGLKNILESQGKVLFSGLLVSDREDILQACEKESLALVTEGERNNWVSLLFVKQI